MANAPFARARCDACVYWNRLSGTHGSCRRHPPGLLQPANESDGPFPITKPTHWCGAWTHPDEVR